MDKNNDIKTKQDRFNQTQDKIDKMRIIAHDSERCKEIAQKLCAYIAKNS